MIVCNRWKLVRNCALLIGSTAAVVVAQVPRPLTLSIDVHQVKGSISISALVLDLR